MYLVLLGATSGYKFYYSRVMHNLFISAKHGEVEVFGSESKSFETSSDVFDFWSVSVTHVSSFKEIQEIHEVGLLQMPILNFAVFCI